VSGWVRFENATPDAVDRKAMHRGVSSPSDKAFRLWFNAICFCSHAETDGRVPGDKLCELSRTATKKVVQELVDIGLLEVDGTNYVVHDYLHYNPSRARVNEMRDQGRKRAARYRGNADVTPLLTDEVTDLPLRAGAVRSGSSTAVVNDQGKRKPARARDENVLPGDFPDELIPHLDAVERILTDLAVRHEAKAVNRLALASAIAANPRKALVAEARGFTSWADDQPTARHDVLAGYRNWLKKSPSLAATERLNGGGPLLGLARPGRKENASDWLQEDFVDGEPIVDAQPVEDEGDVA
jgi:hypothetical protein